MPADFIDSNVLVYSLDRSDRRKQAVADAVVRGALGTASGCISFQVVHECLNVVLRKAEVRLTAEASSTWAEAVLLPLLRVHSSAALTRRALDLHRRWQLGFYDALIVAAALEAGCNRLLSEDLQHGRRIEHLVVENPFVAQAG